jgi:hypothetical protein
MILRKDYVNLIKEGKAQVEVEKNEEHNEMLTLLFTERCKLKVTIHLMDTYYKFDNTAYNYSSSIVHPFENLPIIHASDIILDNTVIKVESEEHGKRVVEWWKGQGVDTRLKEGSACTMNYYGMYNGMFDNWGEANISGKKIITLPETFPSKWYMICDENNKEIGDKWLKENNTPCNLMHGNAYCSKNDYGDLWFGCGGEAKEFILKYNSDYTEITTDQFLENVYKPFKAKQETKQENKMRTITWNQGQEIIDIACKDWKEKLFDVWGKKIVLKKPIEIQEHVYQEMRKACTKEQHELFDKIFGKEKEEISLGGIMIKNDYIQLREGGEHKGKALVLSENYNWEIKKDNYNFLCLIPTHKE